MNETQLKLLADMESLLAEVEQLHAEGQALREAIAAARAAVRPGQKRDTWAEVERLDNLSALRIERLAKDSYYLGEAMYEYRNTERNRRGKL